MESYSSSFIRLLLEHLGTDINKKDKIKIFEFTDKWKESLLCKYAILD